MLLIQQLALGLINKYFHMVILINQTLYLSECKCSETAGVCVGSCGGASIASLFGREEAEEF